MEQYILDACALIAVLTAESGADKIRVILQQAFRNRARVSMNKINLLEVYYDDYRTHGSAAAVRMLEKIKETPITIISEINDEIFLEAGRLKAVHKLSLADSIAIASASVSGAALITADHHEMDAVEAAERIRFFWIR
jgi:predicted nucleic acid-binding protein